VGAAGALHLATLVVPPLRALMGLTTHWPVALAWAAAGAALPLAIAAVRGALPALDRARSPSSVDAVAAATATARFDEAAAPPVRRAPARTPGSSAWRFLSHPIGGVLGRDEFVVLGAAAAT
jgi:hypothetical protein